MQFNISQQRLAKILKNLISIVPKKNNTYALPIIMNIYMVAVIGAFEGNGAIEFTVTNGTIGLKQTIRDIKVKEAGQTTVTAHKFVEFVNSLPKTEEDIEFKLGWGDEPFTLRLKGSNTTARFRGMDPDEFPLVATDEYALPDKKLVVLTDHLKKAIDFVSYAASTDEGRPVLTGIHIGHLGEKLVFESADGFRLSTFNIPMTEPQEFNGILPANGMATLSGLLNPSYPTSELYLVNNDNMLIVKNGDTIFSSQLIAGEYPDVQRIIPEDTVTKVKVTCETFHTAVKRAMIISKNLPANVIHFIVNKNTSELIVKSVETAEEGNIQDIVPATVTGQDEEFILNGAFVNSVLNSLSNAEEVTIGINSNTQPIMIHTTEDQFIHVVMPIRI